MDQRRRQGHPLTLSAGEGPHLLGKIRDSQPSEHGLGLIFVKRPELRRIVAEYLLQDRGLLVHDGILRQNAHLDVRIPGDRATVRLQHAGEDFQKRGLPGTVDADDAHLVPLIEIKIYILQQLPAAEIDGKMFRG